MSFAVKKSQACSSNCGKTGSERFQGRSLQGSWQFIWETWAVAMVNLPSKAVLEFKQMPTSWGNDHILSLKVVSYLHLFSKAPETSDAMSKLYQTVLKCFFVRHQIRGKNLLMWNHVFVSSTPCGAYLHFAKRFLGVRSKPFSLPRLKLFVGQPSASSVDDFCEIMWNPKELVRFGELAQGFAPKHIIHIPSICLCHLGTAKIKDQSAKHR